MFGNHHDAWVNGADDPISGAVSLMEVARGLGELLRGGWRPKRTIVLALWDGEEWGLLGSTEWAEAHRDELNGKGVVYINTDGTGKGWLNAGGSHSLQQFVTEVARDINDPRTGKPVLEVGRRKAIEGPARGRARRGREGSEHPHRPARLGLRLHAVPAASHRGLAQPELRRRKSRRRLSLGLRLVRVVHAFFRHRLHLRPHARAGDGHRGAAPVGGGGAAVPVLGHERHARALRGGGAEAPRREEGRAGHRLRAADCGGSGTVEGLDGLREGARRSCRQGARRRCRRRKRRSRS